MKKLILLLSIFALLSCDNSTSDNRSFTEKNTATISWHNTSDYYAIVYYDAEKRLTLDNGVSKVDYYYPDDFAVDVKITLHKKNGSDKYYIDPTTEFTFSQRFSKDIDYKYTISNNKVHAQSVPEL